MSNSKLRGVIAAVATTAMIFSGAPSRAALERLRAIGPGSVPRLAAWTRVLLEIAQAGSVEQLFAMRDLREDPDPHVAMLARQWTSQALENTGDLEGALEAARAAYDLCDDVDGPWQRAMLSSQLASLAAQLGDVPGARRHGEAALGPMEALGAVEDATQLRAMLAICDMREQRFDEAAAMLDRVATEDSSESTFGSRMIVLCGQAELALARGDVAVGLSLYRTTIAALSARGPVPGIEVEIGLEPWVIWPLSGAVAAHARLGRSAGAGLRDDLVDKAIRSLAGSPALFDFPVAGAVAFALGLWELTADAPSEESVRTGVDLLGLADRFAYNRVLPSLDWAPAASVSERVRPGLLDQVLAGYAERPVDDLRAALAKLLDALR